MAEKARRSKNGANGEQSDGADDETALVTTVADRAASVVKRRLTETVDKSVEDLDILAKTLQLASEQLKDNVAAPYVGKVASRMSQLSRFIDETDARALLDRAHSLGREQPLLFFGGVMAIGFAGGRFLRSSATPGPNGAPKAGSKNNEHSKGR